MTIACCNVKKYIAGYKLETCILLGRKANKIKQKIIQKT